MNTTRHKVFISYHHDDQFEVVNFIKTFDYTHDIFIVRALGIDIEQSIIDSDDPLYVMRRIRELYLKDSTVTIVLIGRYTWARRYVDWEIQASLRQGETVTPNGLLGIKLKSYKDNEYPDRLNANLIQNNLQRDCYARVITYPQNRYELFNAIEDAFNARTNRANFIVNKRERMKYNKFCN